MSKAKDSYDKIAKQYDSLFDNESARQEDLWIITDICNRNPKKSIMDLGCGTGLFLDYVDQPPSMYVGIDISQGMITEAKYKHPNHKFMVKSIEDYAGDKFTGKYVISMFGSISYVKPELVNQMMVYLDSFYFMFFKDGYVPVTHTEFKFDCDFYNAGDYDIPKGCDIEDYHNYTIVKK